MAAVGMLQCWAWPGGHQLELVILANAERVVVFKGDRYAAAAWSNKRKRDLYEAY